MVEHKSLPGHFLGKKREKTHFEDWGVIHRQIWMKFDILSLNDRW